MSLRRERGLDELATIAADYGRDVLTATAAQALGAVELAENNAGAALDRAARGLRDMARRRRALRSRAGAHDCSVRACRELGDEDSAAWELDGRP